MAGISRADLPEQISLEELVALALEAAYERRDGNFAQKIEAHKTREFALFITNLEQAALWLTHDRTAHHLGENGLLDSLREI